MSDLHFFDCVESKNNKFIDFCENYFFLEGLSGKLGFKKFTSFSKNPPLIQEQSLYQTSNWKTKALQVVKAVSYLTLVMPCVMLCGKIYQHRRHHTVKDQVTTKVTQEALSSRESSKPINTGLSHQNIQSAKDHVANLWKKYKARINPEPMHLRFWCLKRDSNHNDGLSRINPDLSHLGNLTLNFENDPEVCYLPMEYGLTHHPNEKDLAIFIEGLRAAFASGKPLIVSLLSMNAQHRIAATFKADGQFQIVDSMNGQAIDMSILTEALNKAKIQDSSGNDVKFKGEYTSCNIQSGGHECVRFAALYAYQIAKDRDLSSYAKVNGAIQEGLLKSFEDYKKIDQAQKVNFFKEPDDKKYLDFMTSWTYRSLEFRTDDWKDLTLHDLSDSLFKEEFQESLIYLIEGPNTIPFAMKFFLDGDYYVGEKSASKLLDLNSLKKLPVQDLKQTTLKSLVPEKDETTVVIINAEDKSVNLYQLPPNLKIFNPKVQDAQGNILQYAIFSNKS